MFARTNRLTLRPGWPEDAPALTRAIAHEDVAFKLARLPWPYTKAHALEWLSMPRDADDVSLLIFAHETATPRLIGGVGLFPSSEQVGVEIGYWLTPDAWGRGYATEAGRAVVGMARWSMGLRGLVSGHFLDNPQSGRVLTKLGFRYTGQEQRYCLARDENVECATMALDFADEPACRMPMAA